MAMKVPVLPTPALVCKDYEGTIMGALVISPPPTQTYSVHHNLIGGLYQSPHVGRLHILGPNDLTARANNTSCNFMCTRYP